ncbi:MAG: cyclic nucleotide-binding domain-containing protein [Leptospiraceae bacterium]|nr:cyclic nucleotide-binding domain-containing protein [Leptospiraceae bacterium]
MDSELDLISILKNIEIFMHTPSDKLKEIVKALKEENIVSGDEIIHEGDSGNCLYIIYSGMVKVTKENHQIATLEERQTFGEFSLINSEPRNASIFAIEDCKLLRLDQVDFYRILGNSYEFMRGIVRILNQRLTAQNNELIETLKRREEELVRLVALRTKDLEGALDEIRKQKIDLETSYEEILIQKFEIETKNHHITESIRYAKNIQSSILTSIQYIKSILPESFILFKPRDVVSGDFYWFYSNADEKEIDETEFSILAAVDCTGHGVPGALMSMIANGILNDIVKVKKVTDPGQILTMLNIGLRGALNQEQTEIKDGLDIALCYLDKKNRILKFAGAMNSVYYIQDDILNEIKGNRRSIGGDHKEESQIFQSHELHFNSDLSFYISSDGYYHQFGGANRKKFSTRQFKEVLLEIHKEDVAIQRMILDERISNWMQDHDQLDDILVIGVQIKV